MYVMYIKAMYCMYVCMYVCMYINNLHKHHDKYTYLRGRLLSLWSGLSVLRFDNRRQRAHAVPRQNGRQYRLTIHSHGPIHTYMPTGKKYSQNTWWIHAYIHTYIHTYLPTSQRLIRRYSIWHIHTSKDEVKKRKKRVWCLPEGHDRRR